MEQNRFALAEIFHDYLKTDVYEIAKKKEIKGISKCNKEELIQKLIQELCRPEKAEAYFFCLLDEQIEEFKKAAAQNGLYYSEHVSYLWDLYAGAYIGVLSDGRIQVPQEVIDVYREIETEEFHKKRQRISFLLACLRTSGFLHGIAPISVILTMVNQVCRPEMTAEEVKGLLEEIPAELKEHVLVGDMFYHEMLYPNDRNLLAVQKNKAYYIPTEAEIKDFDLHRYFSQNEEIETFKGYLMAEMDFDREEADEAAEKIQRAMSSAERIGEVIQLLGDLGIEPETMKDAEKLRKRVTALWNKTRMLIHRGHTPEEMELQKAQNKIPKKIYPNDPCPCGSGKKYKNCCRNK